MVSKFTEELREIDHFVYQLSAQGFFIAGVAVSHTNLERTLVCLSAIQKEFEEGKIDETEKSLLEYCVYSGNIEKSEKRLGRTTEKSIEFRQEFNHLTKSALEEIERKTMELVLDLEIAMEEEKVNRTQALHKQRLEAEIEARRHIVKCGICNDPVDEVEFLPLENCGEIFHYNCIHEYLIGKIRKSEIPVLCPTPHCKQEISMLDFRERLDSMEFKEFEDSSFWAFVAKNGDDFYCCPTAECPYVFEATEAEKHFQCPTCAQEYCLNCRVRYHKRISCDKFKESKEGRKIDYNLKGKRFKECGKCRVLVLKPDACNQLDCRCGNKFCYTCGQTKCKC